MKNASCALVIALALASSASAQPRGEAATIRPSGLRALYPTEARCPEIASPFGSRTRYDGSPRPEWSFGGFHGGIDLSLEEGTPLLALAAGTVAGKGEGGMLEGIYIWLRHSPEDTGLAYWVYSKYQHLQAMPALEVGASVKAGETIGLAGSTGTAGRHYGPAGYPHLHLTTRRSPSGEERVGSRGAGGGGMLFDPLLAYRDAAGQSSEEVRIPYATPDGRRWPAQTRLVWPVACAPA